MAQTMVVVNGDMYFFENEVAAEILSEWASQNNDDDELIVDDNTSIWGKNEVETVTTTATGQSFLQRWGIT